MKYRYAEWRIFIVDLSVIMLGAEFIIVLLGIVMPIQQGLRVGS